MNEYTNIQTERPPLVPTTEPPAPEPRTATKKVETAEPPAQEPATATQGAGTADTAGREEPTTEQMAEQGQAIDPDAAADADAEPPAPEPQIEKVEQENYLMGAQEVAALLNVTLSMAYKIIRDCNDELRAENKLVIRGKVLKKYLLKKIEV